MPSRMKKSNKEVFVELIECDEKREYVDQLLRQFPDVFKQGVNQTKEELFDLRITDADIHWKHEPKSCWRKNYVSDIPDREVTEHINLMLDEGIIRRLEPHNSVHAIIAPLNFIRKPNGKIRPTVDFRDVNTCLAESEAGALKP